MRHQSSKSHGGSDSTAGVRARLSHRTRLGKRRRAESGIALIELLAMILLLTSIMVGLIHGLQWGARHGKWLAVVGGIGGAVLGVLVVVAAAFMVVSPFALYAAIKRILEPADLVCTCDAVGQVTPENLAPRTPLETEAFAESCRLAELPALACLRGAAVSEAWLRDRVNQSPMYTQRIALAARLGDPAARSFGLPAPQPLLDYDSWTKLPKDLQAVLRSGLPPRLCLLWALTCAERALRTFEREFHQDKRPRIAIGACLLLLEQPSPERLALCRTPTLTPWSPSKAGCRVLHRGFWTRFSGRRSQGQLAIQAIQIMARASADFVEPDRLWAVYAPGDIANGYETAQNRCRWSNPPFHTEDIAHEVALAADSREAELQLQRQTLARLILSWDRWDEDCQDWQCRVVEEWIPRITKELKGTRIDLPEYVARLRKEWVPWRAT